MDTSVAGGTVKRNILVNLEEHLLKDLKNISRAPHQSVTTQTIPQMLKMSALWEGRSETLLD